MFDIVSIGGATQDVFVRSEGAQVLRLSDRLHEKAWLGFDYGAKVSVEQLKFTVGGGATNTSVAFSRLGLQAACLVKLGQDRGGEQVLEELSAQGVATSLVCQSEGQTGFSVILTSYEGERSILAFRGLNRELHWDDLDLQALAQTRWLYLSSLSGDSGQIIAPLLDFAAKHGIQVAMNPGSTQLKTGLEALKPLLAQVDLLFLNKEEAAQLTGLELRKPPEEHLRLQELSHPHRPPYMYDLDAHLQTLKAVTRGTVILTDGPRGTQAYNGREVWAMPVFPVDVADVLGAGDAFGAAFTAAWIQQEDLEQALCWGAANAAGVVTDPGAHNGLQDRVGIQRQLERYPAVRPVSYPLSIETASQ